MTRPGVVLSILAASLTALVMAAAPALASPTLTSGTVYVVGAAQIPTVNAQNVLVPTVTGSVISKFVFHVTYTDPNYVQGVSPAPAVSVTLNNAQTIGMQPAPGDPLNYASGVVYTTGDTGMTLSAGPQTFHFNGSDGVTAVTFPAAGDITGLSVVNLPSLLAPAPTNGATNGGTLTPLVGPLSTNFTYSIIYQHPDGTAPAQNGVVLVLDPGTSAQQSVVMTSTGGANPNYTSGVTYTAQVRFNSGTSHTYRFTAVDSVTPSYTATYPAGGATLTGPTVNIATFSQPSFSPAAPVVSQPLKITGKLNIANQIAVTIGIQLVRPDGTGLTGQAVTDTSGNFTYTFTPNETGDWSVSFSFNGISGVYDPLTSQYTFSVGGQAISLVAGEEDMIASPLLPTTPNPTVAFNPTNNAVPPASQPISVVNLIVWVPDPSGNGGSYSALNTSGNFPGILPGAAYWVKPSQNVVLNPSGTLTDQTKSYTLSLAAGWNMIGSVYLNSTNWGATQVNVNGQMVSIGDASQIVRPTAWTYNATTGSYTQVSPSNGVLAPYRGYWVHALQPVGLVLAPPGTKAAKRARPTAVAAPAGIQVAAVMGDRSDTDNYAPLTRAAVTAALYDKPPFIGNYVAVRFVPADQIELPAASRAAAAAADNVVAFEVETDHKNADVTVAFPNAATIGRQADATVVDLSTGAQTQIASGAQITYNSGPNASTRRFALIINRADASNRLVVSMPSTRGQDRSGALTFSYTVSRAATVQAQIVSTSTGAAIRTLVSGRAATTGVNTLTWDGRDNRGQAVPTGSYLIKLSATDSSGHRASTVAPVVIVR